jgi:hypothetical protein
MLALLDITELSRLQLSSPFKKMTKKSRKKKKEKEKNTRTTLDIPGLNNDGRSPSITTCFQAGGRPLMLSFYPNFAEVGVSGTAPRAAHVRAICSHRGQIINLPPTMWRARPSRCDSWPRSAVGFCRETNQVSICVAVQIYILLK